MAYPYTGKRGKTLETMIDHTNKIYVAKGWALINKVPTPWNVSYDRRTGRVYRAFPEEKGTVDYIGVSHGRSIAFDAKSTNIRTSFPLKNVQKHQYEYLRTHQDQGGISFLIIDFAKLQETFLLSFDHLNDFWIDSFRGGRKSIPYAFFNLNCDRIKAERGVAVDYLKIVERG